jgi:hypothetical protein
VLHRHLLPVLSILAQTLQSLIHVSGCSIGVLSGVWIIFGVFFLGIGLDWPSTSYGWVYKEFVSTFAFQRQFSLAAWLKPITLSITACTSSTSRSQ